MKISCFSFIRDGMRLGYPFEESIRSALPICDEFVIAVGHSDDGTLERLEDLQEPRLRLIGTTWNHTCRNHGFVYGHQKMIPNSIARGIGRSVWRAMRFCASRTWRRFTPLPNITWVIPR